MSLLHFNLHYLARHEGNESFDLNFDKLDIVDVFTELLNVIRYIYQEKNLDFKLELAPSRFKIRIDERYVRVALFIVLQSAVENAQENNPIWITYNQVNNSEARIQIMVDAKEAEEGREFLNQHYKDDYTQASLKAYEVQLDLAKKLLEIQNCRLEIQTLTRKKLKAYSISLISQRHFRINDGEDDGMERVALEELIDSRLYDNCQEASKDVV